MSKEVRTNVFIAAPVEAVWEILTDFAALVEWTNLYRIVSGEAKPGATLQMEVRLPIAPGPLRFERKVLAVEAPKELRWRGPLVDAGLLSSEHWFNISVEAGGCRVEQGQRFSGPLSPLIGASILGAMRASLDSMNFALKRRAEGASMRPERERAPAESTVL